MANRITMHGVFMEFARVVAERSVCQRRVQVGCIIANGTLTNVVGIGYNGPARGLPHDCDAFAPGACTCIHAEVNALLKAPYDAVGGLIMFTTLSPCDACARLILNSRVKEVCFLTEYRTITGLKILQDNGVKTTRMLV